jgi:hypothetical protein
MVSTTKVKECDAICKQAVTIHEFIDKKLEDDRLYYNLNKTKVKFIRKITRKFLKNIKGTNYETSKDRWNKTYVSNIEDHIDTKDDLYPTNLTWLQFQFHDFIHAHCQEYDPAIRDNMPKIEKFYNQTLENLRI